MACQSSDMSLNEFTDENLSFLDMELEALQSIFINELEVKEKENCTAVSIDLYPSTADKLDQQYVRMTLQFILDEEYPEKIPEIKIRNPRGLSDDELNSISEDLLMIAESKRGSSMLFEMIDAAKEHLTVGNRPSGECAICLHGFSDNDVFTKTECYHYFHSHCLARYAKNFFDNLRNAEDNAENKSKSDELLCPMCRIPIEFDEWDIDYPPPVESDESNFTLSEDMIELQKKMSALFEKQVKKGGIIDVEAEKNKYLLEISNVPTRLSSEEKCEQNPVGEDSSVVDSKTEEPDESGSPVCDKKDYVRDQSKRFDYRQRNRNFNRPNNNRNYNRYDQRYNKQSYNQRNYNKYRYGKQNSENSYQDEPEETKDSSVQDITQNEDLSNNSSNMVEHDDVCEASNYPSPNSKPKYNPNFSPRYKNRGYHHGRNNYNSENTRQLGKSGYDEHRSSQSFHRYSVQRAEESSSKYEKKFENDLVTNDDDNPKSDYRSGNYNHDNEYSGKQRYYDRNNSQDYSTRQRYYDNRNNSHDYSAKQKYGDNRNNSYDYSTRQRYDNRNSSQEYYTKQRYDSRNNSHNGFKGAYNGRDSYNARDSYSNSYNSRGNKYTDSRNRERYQERDNGQIRMDNRDKRTYRDTRYRNNDDNTYNRSKQDTRNYSESREKWTYRDTRYRNNDDNTYNRSKQGTRNYSESRPERHSDRPIAVPSNIDSESLELNNENQNSDQDTLPAENGCLGSSNSPNDSSQGEEKSLDKKDLTDLEEKNPSKVSAFNSSASNILPNAFGENSDITPRTVNPPPGFANPSKKVVYGLQGANPPPGFNRS